MADKFNHDFIKKVEDEIRRKVIERMNMITINIHNRVTTETWVDYGQARAGWNIALNKPDITVPDRLPQPEKIKGNSQKRILPPNPSVILNDANKLGDSYFVTNNVEHIKWQNEGTIYRAPTNFIEIETIQAVKDIG